MMKFVSVFVVLLHLCHSAPTDMNLNNEIQNKLKTLNDHVDIPTNKTLYYPSRQMRGHATSCVNVFVKNLRDFLKKVQIPEGYDHLRTAIEANLNLLEQIYNQSTTFDSCTMFIYNPSSKPFTQYINFIKKLNSSKKK